MNVVVLPGIGLDQRAYAPTTQHLCDLPVSVLRLPGFGLTASRHVNLSPVALARGVIDQLAGRRLQQVVLVGHSASCQVVAHVAADRRVLGAMLIGPTTDPRAKSWSALAGRWLGTARHEEPSMIPTLTRQYSHTGLPSMARAMEAARHDDITVGLERLGKPVRVIRGPHDKIAPEDWTEHLAAATTFGSAATVGGGGHMIVITDGAAVAQEIRDLVRIAEAPASR